MPMSTVPFTEISRLFINGDWEPVQGREAVLNPATETSIGHAPVGDVAAARAAIDAARTAFDSGPWPHLPMAERAAIMRRMHSALVAKRERIAQLIIAEVGCAQGITYPM